MNRQGSPEEHFLLLFLTLVLSLSALHWVQASSKALVSHVVNSWMDVGVLDVETQTIQNLTNTPKMHEFALDWSPDGQRVLFVSNRPQEGRDQPRLEVMNANGTGRRALDFIKGDSWDADWSPRGERIVLGLKKDDNEDIYTVNLDGSEFQRLTEHPADDDAPIWSPDGRQIAFFSNREGSKQLYGMDADGNSLIQLTHEAFGALGNASWSPEGTRLVFIELGIGKKPALFIVDSKGRGKPRQLVPREAEVANGPVHWLPDGKILYHSLRGIFMVEVREDKTVFRGENAMPLLLFEEGVNTGRILVEGWFDPAYARPQAVQPRGKVSMLLGQVKAAALWQNYPNPFNPDTWIPFELSVDGSVTLQIHDVQGHLVRTLGLGSRKAGTYLLPSQAAYWDGRDYLGKPVGSGMYFYTLQVGQFSETRRMVVLK